MKNTCFIPKYFLLRAFRFHRKMPLVQIRQWTLSPGAMHGARKHTLVAMTKTKHIDVFWRRTALARKLIFITDSKCFPCKAIKRTTAEWEWKLQLHSWPKRGSTKLFRRSQLDNLRHCFFHIWINVALQLAMRGGFLCFNFLLKRQRKQKIVLESQPER